jgi:hypothetical protein
MLAVCVFLFWARKYYTENKNINNGPQDTTQKTKNINNGPQNTTKETKNINNGPQNTTKKTKI